MDIQKKIDQNPEIDTDTTNKRLDQRFSAHIEGFCATQEQELNIKATSKRREKDQAKKSMDVRCRV